MVFQKDIYYSIKDLNINKIQINFIIIFHIPIDLKNYIFYCFSVNWNFPWNKPHSTNAITKKITAIFQPEQSNTKQTKKKLNCIFAYMNRQTKGNVLIISMKKEFFSFHQLSALSHSFSSFQINKFFQREVIN